MTPGQTARVLAKAQAFDRRTVGETDVLAWHEVIGHLNYTDCLAAVTRHYADTTDWLMPAHVRRLVAEIDRERRRAERELAETAQRQIESRRAVPAHDRSADVQQLIADLRDKLPTVDAVILRRPETVAWDRERERQARAQPNPHYDPTINPPALPEEPQR